MPLVQSEEPISHQQAQIVILINLRLPTVSTILPMSAPTSRDNSTCFPPINWRIQRAWSTETWYSWSGNIKPCLIYVILSYIYYIHETLDPSRKYRALSPLELWERLFDMCLVDYYDEMVRDLCGISNEDWLTTEDTNPSRSDQR